MIFFALQSAIGRFAEIQRKHQQTLGLMKEAFPSRTLNEEWDMWQRLCTMLEKQFGMHCEIILHDLTKDYDHTIVDIRNGYITGRRIGDCGSNLGLEVLRGTVEHGDRFNYVVHTRDGKILRSSTMFIKNDEGEVIGSLCINLDITFTVNMEEFLKQYNSYDMTETTPHTQMIPLSPSAVTAPPAGDESEIFANDISQVLEFIIRQADQMFQKPVEQLSRDEKIEYVRFMDKKGAFLVTKSSDKVCEHLGISRYTLYNYLELIRDSKKKSEGSDCTP